MDNQQIVSLKPAQIDVATQIIANAFSDTPLFSYMLPSTVNDRVKKIQHLSKFALRYGSSYSHTYINSGEPKGVAIWMLSDRFTTDILRLLRAGLWAIPFQVGLGVLKRQMDLMNPIEEAHKRNMQQQHWYLAVLGVDPLYQRQGIGSALLDPILKQADRDRIPCYLETFGEKNLRFYSKHGFEVTDRVDFPDIPLHLLAMTRKPR
jgi:ribosomal protein S18 acetylase RimI-like enzyme